MIAHVGWPGVDELDESGMIIREQGARSLFKIWQITGHGRHEVIGGFLLPPALVDLLVGAPCRLDEFTNRDRRASGLGTQPLPVSRQQRHFARNHPQSRPAASA